MKKFYIKPLVAAIALTAAGQGYAQEASAENTLEEVVVTGFRGSLQSSLNTKRDSVGVVDAIYAEDIADFPDNNLAESLQRILVLPYLALAVKVNKLQFAVLVLTILAFVLTAWSLCHLLAVQMPLVVITAVVVSTSTHSLLTFLAT